MFQSPVLVFISYPLIFDGSSVDLTFCSMTLSTWVIRRKLRIICFFSIYTGPNVTRGSRLVFTIYRSKDCFKHSITHAGRVHLYKMRDLKKTLLLLLFSFETELLYFLFYFFFFCVFLLLYYAGTQRNGYIANRFQLILHRHLRRIKNFCYFVFFFFLLVHFFFTILLSPK